MASPYKRRRPSLVRNFWVYRKLIALAMVLGLMLWFIWANNAPVTVSFPFRLGVAHELGRHPDPAERPGWLCGHGPGHDDDLRGPSPKACRR